MSSSESKNIKITYFNVPGRAEPTRLLLTYGGIPFVDERIKFEDFPKLREESGWHFKQLPVMEINGEIISQSGAMERYAAKLVGLYPNDPIVAARVDMMAGAVSDILEAAVEIHMTKNNDELKQERIKKIIQETFPKLLGGMEKYVKGQYLIGDEPTYADIFFYSILKHGVDGKIPGFSWDAYPKLHATFENVKNLPKIAAYEKSKA